MKRPWMKKAILATAALTVANMFFYTVTAGHRAIVLTLGRITDVESEGLHFKVPFLHKIQDVSVRMQKLETNANAVSKNMQHIFTKVTLNYNLNPLTLKQQWETIGPDIVGRIMPARVQESVKAIVARYTAEELITLRQMVKDEIAAQLIEQFGMHYIEMQPDGVQITDFTFSEAFGEAIEQKQIAEQHALKATNDLERIRVEAEQKIAEAKGNAEAIRIQAEAIQRQGGKDYIQMKAIEKWDGRLPQVSGGGAVPFVNISPNK